MIENYLQLNKELFIEKHHEKLGSIIGAVDFINKYLDGTVREDFWLSIL